jgi:hypothetical protein
LVLLFVVNTLFGLFPLQLIDPAWQLRVADLLRTTAPFTLLGAALIYLCELVGGMSPAWLPLQRIQRLAPLAALGFLLLIPLQVHASWMQIRNADGEAQKTIRSVERRITAVRAVASSADLAELSKGLPPDWQPLPEQSLTVNRSRLLARVEPELGRLRSLARTNKSAAVQKRLQDGLRDALLNLIYAVTFVGLRPRSFAELPLGPDGGESGDPHAAAEAHRAEGPMHGRKPEQPELNPDDRHPWYP